MSKFIMAHKRKSLVLPEIELIPNGNESLIWTITGCPVEEVNGEYKKMDPFTYEGTTLVRPYTNGKYILEEMHTGPILYGITSKGLTQLYHKIDNMWQDSNSGDAILGMTVSGKTSGGKPSVDTDPV